MFYHISKIRFFSIFGKGLVYLLIILLLPGKFFAQQNFQDWVDQEEKQVACSQ